MEAKGELKETRPQLAYYGRESIVDYYRGKVNALEESPTYSPFRVLGMIETMERIEADYAACLSDSRAVQLPPVLDITIFNSKLKAQLALGKRTAALETLKCLETRGIAPNQMTFVYLFQELSKYHASLRHVHPLLTLMTRKHSLAPNALIYFYLIKCVKRLSDVPFALQCYRKLRQSGPVDAAQLASLIRFASTKRLTPLLRFLLAELATSESHAARLLAPFYPTLMENLLPIHDPYAIVDLLLFLLQRLDLQPLHEALYKACMTVAESTCSLPLALAILRHIVSCSPCAAQQQSLLTTLYLSTLRVALAPGAFQPDASFSSPLQLVFVLLYDMSQRAMPVSLDDLVPFVQYMATDEGRLEEGEQVMAARFEEMTRQALGEAALGEAALVAFGQHASAFYHALLLGHASRDESKSVPSRLQSTQIMSTYRIPKDAFHFHALIQMSSMTGRPAELLAIVQAMAAARIPPTISTMKRILSGLFDSCTNAIDSDALAALHVAKDYLQRFMSQPSPSALFTLSLTSHLGVLLERLKEHQTSRHSAGAPSLETMQCIQDIEAVAHNWTRISNSKF